MSIVTKKGDKGKTDALNKRIDKDDTLIEVIGTIDELKAFLELIGSEEKIVNDLSELMGHISCNIKTDLSNKILYLDSEINNMENKLPILKKFITFENIKALQLNYARTIARKTERRIVTLLKREKLNDKLLQYFNRLSDYLYLRARIRNNIDNEKK